LKGSSIFLFHVLLNTRAERFVYSVGVPETLPEEKVWSDERACKLSERVLDDLMDGKWHSVRDLMAHVSPVKLKKILEFYEEYEFIEWNRESGLVRLNWLTMTFLQKIFQTSNARWKKRAKR